MIYSIDLRQHEPLNTTVMNDPFDTTLPNAFLVSALSSPLMPAQHLAMLGQQSPVNGIEIDLQDTLRYRLQGWHSASAAERTAVRAVWFPPPLENKLSPQVEHLIQHRQQSGLPVTLIVDQPRRRTRDAIRNQITFAIKLRTRLPASTRIAIGVRPHQIENTRAHLANLAGLRLQASEWDIDIALDLGRELDWLWEAEAAIYRVIGSLGMIRLSYPTNTFDGRFRASLTQRAITSCSELGYTRDFSLMVPLPWWHWRNSRALQAACREASAGIERQLKATAAAFDFERQADRFADRS
ncbi:hypothetical protein BH23CHL4_BH23CHL4_16180 [soil metagenome]